MKKILPVFFAILLLLILPCRAQHPKRKPITTLPNIDIYDLNGEHTRLTELGKNKVVLIDCWFIPCPPCFREMNMLHKLYFKYKDNKNISFITICRTDSGIVKKFLAKDKSAARWVEWYQNYSKLTNFELPIYFMPGCSMEIYMDRPTALAKPKPEDKTKCPDAVFSFRGYPTTMIFNRTGKMVMKKTGYVEGEDATYSAKIEKFLKEALATK
jgi:thiol-disulfide isomerase/thioredoxin